MRVEYNKLIRDRIPEIIKADGKQYAVEVMGLDEFRKALLAKLVEEAQEVAEADLEKLDIELADLQEVVCAIMKAFCIDPADVENIKKYRFQCL